MKIHENQETGEFTIKPESKEERLLFRLVLTVCHQYPQRELDQIRRDYDTQLKHCSHHHGLAHQVLCPYCKNITGKTVNYRCGLPLGHDGPHFFMSMWDELDGMNVATLEGDSRIILDRTGK